LTFDFARLPLQRDAFSTKPMSILTGPARASLAAIEDLILLEVGDRRARERWQRAQLRNLIEHATRRSAFWRERLGSRALRTTELRTLPILTRNEVRTQIVTEGSLLTPADGVAVGQGSTSGSSGTPVTFFHSKWNSSYNSARSNAQYFLEGRDITLNRTRLYTKAGYNGFDLRVRETYMRDLAPILRIGQNIHVNYWDPDIKQMVAALRKHRLGHLVASARIVESIFSHFDPAIIRQLSVATWISVGEGISPELRNIFNDMSVPIRATYSSEEVGAIAFECPVHAGHYHCAESNVLVEVASPHFDAAGGRVGKVLVTHLHSYATPFIRYDLGDLAGLLSSCPCGHQGTTIFALEGRESGVLRHRDGRVSAFHIRGKELERLGTFKDFRIRQTDFDRLTLELGGRDGLMEAEQAAFEGFLRDRAGQHFSIEVRACPEIEWGSSRKRHAFRSEVK
jgi:phenylacetate-CoA ligase